MISKLCTSFLISQSFSPAESLSSRDISSWVGAKGSSPSFLSSPHQKSKLEISSALFQSTGCVSSLGVSISIEKSSSVDSSFFSSSVGISKLTSSAASEVGCVLSELKSKSHNGSQLAWGSSLAHSSGVSRFTSNEGADSSFLSSSVACPSESEDVTSEKSKSKLSSVGLDILSNFSRLSNTSCEPPNSGFLASSLVFADDTWFAELFAAVGVLSAISLSYK